VDHHDEIIAAASQRIRWVTFCAEATRTGLTDTRGRPATERNAWETWRQARRMVEQAKLLQAASSTVPKPLSRVAPGRQAPIVPPPPIRPAASPATSGTTPAPELRSHQPGR